MRNKAVLKIKPIWAMCKCIVSMATHRLFEDGGALVIAHISAVTYLRLLYLVRIESLDIDLLSVFIYKLSNFRICIFINIYENIKNVIHDGVYLQSKYYLSFLLIIDYSNWYQFKAQTPGFHSKVKIYYYLICIICVFMNINKNVKIYGKIIKTINKLTISSYYHCCMFKSSVISFDKAIHPVVSYACS